MSTPLSVAVITTVMAARGASQDFSMGLSRLAVATNTGASNGQASISTRS